MVKAETGPRTTLAWWINGMTTAATGIIRESVVHDNNAIL